jgi:hypothetical protein
MVLDMVISEFLLLFRFHRRQIIAGTAELLCSMELETVGIILYAFFWMILRRMNFLC